MRVVGRESSLDGLFLTRWNTIGRSCYVGQRRNMMRMTERIEDLRLGRKDQVVVIVIKKPRVRRRKGERAVVNHPQGPDHVIEIKRVAGDDALLVLHLRKEILDVETNLEINDHEAGLETDVHAVDQSQVKDRVKDPDPGRDLRGNTRRSDIRTSAPSSS